MVNSRCGLLFQILVVDLPQDPVLKSGMPTLRIVPEFDVPHHVAACMLTGRIVSAMNPLVFNAAKNESARESVTAALPGSTPLPWPSP